MLNETRYLCFYCANFPLALGGDSIPQYSVIREKNIILMFTIENTPCFANNIHPCRHGKNILTI